MAGQHFFKRQLFFCTSSFYTLVFSQPKLLCKSMYFIFAYCVEFSKLLICIFIIFRNKIKTFCLPSVCKLYIFTVCTILTFVLLFNLIKDVNKVLLFYFC